jgi:hypothetical protein
MSNIIEENAARILEYIRLHPGRLCEHIEMALYINSYDFTEARQFLGAKIKAVRVGSERYWYLAEAEVTE